MTLTSAGDLKLLLELTDGAIHSLKILTATLDEKCGDHSPGLSKVSSSLNSIRGLLYTSHSQRPESHPTTPEKTMETDDSSMPVDPSLQTPEEAIESGALSVGPIRSRAEAYRRLSEAADYLIKDGAPQPGSIPGKACHHMGQHEPAGSLAGTGAQ